MSDFDKMCSSSNLTRAYRWLLSNPDVRYKGFFRDSYSAFALSSGENIARLRSDLKGERYEATHASKIFIPKASGTLRPITLLCTDDQIIYQACANIVAEALPPSTRNRYRKSVYNHLYAGSHSKFFYLKWQDSYRAFGNRIRALHSQGFEYLANFDLTSFYDSIDHNVLRHFLGELKLDSDFVEFVLKCLRVWTSSTWSNTSNAIYHNHGIPQGPLSSGIFSEVMLAYLDKRGEQGRRTHYLRYADDVKILARKEIHLKQKLVALDMAAKDVGLFPQTSKINIRHVDDVESEIKSVSRPPEMSLMKFDRQKSLRRRIVIMMRGGRVEASSVTRFKYLLSRADPHSDLNERLLIVLENQPDLSEQISFYFSKYKKLPAKAARGIIKLVCRPELYHSIHADLLNCCIDNMMMPERDQLSTYCYGRIFDKRVFKLSSGYLKPQPTYQAALNIWAVRGRRVSFAELEKLRDDELDWWVRKSLLREVSPSGFGAPSYSSFLKGCLSASDAELARCAVPMVAEGSIRIRNQWEAINDKAQIPLRMLGIISRVSRPTSLVGTVFDYILKRKKTPYDWRKLLGKKHNQAERMAVLVKQTFEVDIDACVVRLDSLCDLIFETIYRRIVGPEAGYIYGSVLKNPNARLKAAVPDVIVSFAALHSARLQSFTAHPRGKRAGASTKRLKHYDFRKLKPALLEGIGAIEASIVP